jgi:hypothetical protein
MKYLHMYGHIEYSIIELMISVNKIIGHTSITSSLVLPYSKKCRDILALRNLVWQPFLLQVDFCSFNSLNMPFSVSVLPASEHNSMVCKPALLLRNLEAEFLT